MLICKHTRISIDTACARATTRSVARSSDMHVHVRVDADTDVDVDVDVDVHVRR